jgi:hypothetical protein
VEIAETGPSFRGYGGRLSHPDWGLCAVGDGDGRYRVQHAEGSSRIAVPDGTAVLGVARNLRRGSQPGLLVKEADGRSLVLVGQSWTVRLPRASAEIRHVALSPAAAHVAYTTASGDLVIYSLDLDCVLFRLLPTAD